MESFAGQFRQILPMRKGKNCRSSAGNGNLAFF
jgi:hypothetical protein